MGCAGVVAAADWFGVGAGFCVGPALSVGVVLGFWLGFVLGFWLGFGLGVGVAATTSADEAGADELPAFALARAALAFPGSAREAAALTRSLVTGALSVLLLVLAESAPDVVPAADGWLIVHAARPATQSGTTTQLTVRRENCSRPAGGRLLVGSRLATYPVVPSRLAIHPG